MAIKYHFTVESVNFFLRETPKAEELERLIKYYPTYSFPHRQILIEGIMEKNSPVLIAEKKMKAKGIDPSKVSKQSKGAHTRWATAKLRRFVRRMLYLRHRLDEGLSKIQANQELLKLELKFSDKEENVASLQRTVRKDTQCSLLPDK